MKEPAAAHKEQPTEAPAELAVAPAEPGVAPAMAAPAPVPVPVAPGRMLHRDNFAFAQLS